MPTGVDPTGVHQKTIIISTCMLQHVSHLPTITMHARSTSHRAMTLCGCGVKAGMVRVWGQVKLCDPLVTHWPYLSALEMQHYMSTADITSWLQMCSRETQPVTVVANWGIYEWPLNTGWHEHWTLASMLYEGSQQSGNTGNELQTWLYSHRVYWDLIKKKL